MKTAKQRLLHLTRALHTYLTMFALLLLIFFSFTGFIINHEDSFALSEPRITTRTATLPTTLLKDHLLLVEHLRKSLGARGELKSLDDTGDPLRLQFTSPGRKTEYSITLATGATEITYETRGIFGLMSDLHTGNNTTLPWKLVIDASALLLFLASLTGVILWISMPKRRQLGLITLVISTALCLIVYFLLTP